MPATTRKRKASEEEDATPEVVPAAKKTSRASRKLQTNSQEQPSKARKSAKKGRSGTIAEDRPGNLGSGIAATKSKTTPLRKTMISLEHEQTSKSPNTVYQKSCEHLQNMQEAIDEYKRLNHATANLKKPLEIKQWEQDSEDIAKVDKRAMEIMINTLNGIILGEKKADYHHSPTQSADEIEQAARRWLQTGVSIREDTWGDAVREALKALSGIAKILS
ncbi:hypothetical protein ACSS6W_005478 [Trichoderma asperelloides]